VGISAPVLVLGGPPGQTGISAEAPAEGKGVTRRMAGPMTGGTKRSPPAPAVRPIRTASGGPHQPAFPEAAEVARNLAAMRIITRGKAAARNGPPRLRKDTEAE